MVGKYPSPSTQDSTMPAASIYPKSLPGSARDRLLDVALELFATRGYQAIGLRDLAGQLGLHAGSLYAHFENKQCLLFELIEGAVSDLLADTKRRMRGARTQRDRLQRFVHAFVAFNLAEKHRLVLVTREFVNLTDEQQREINLLKSSYAALLRAIIAAERGESGCISDRTGLITEAVIGMLYGQSLWQSTQVPEQKLTDALTHFVVGIVNYGKDSALKA
jgi:AcrR family transcriptional regulator